MTSKIARWIGGTVTHYSPSHNCIVALAGRRRCRRGQQQHQHQPLCVQYQAGCNHWSVPFSSSALHREAMDSSSSSSSDSTNSRSGNHTDGEAEYGLFRLLTKETRSLLHEQRRLTEASRQVAAQVMALGQGGDAGKGKGGLTAAMDCSKSTSFLEDLRLESTFSVVIAGEFNAGKSTLINALLGRKLLETGALPTTDSITIVAGSDYYNQEFDDSDNVDTGMRRSAPLGVIVHSVHDLPLLEDLTLIDSPGTNSTWMDHTERTMRLLPAADMILFVTSADRPFSESERTLLKSIEAYRKSIVVVINKMDILDLAGGNHGEDQKKAVVDFVTDRASELLGARPVVIPISARDALSAKLMAKTITTTPPSFNDDDDQPTIQHRSNVWTRSNFFALESFLKESLTAQARLKSKLSNPLGVTDGVMNECISIIRTQRDDLQVDVATLNIFQSQFEGWKKELIADLTMSRSAMTDMVRHEGQRCQILTSRMTWYNFYYWVLVDTPSLYKEWEETKREITIFRHQENLKAALVEQVLETADSVATRGRAQGQAAIEYLGKRPAMKNQSLIGSVTAASRFEDTRKALVERLSSVLDLTILNDKDQELEQKKLFHSLHQTASISTALHMGGLGSAILLALDILDPVMGGISLSLLVAGGVGSYTLGINRITRQFQHEWSQRAQIMDKALEAIGRKELDRVNQRILAGVAPYTRFVESEQARLEDLLLQCEGIQSAARSLRNRINKMT